jgi:hypothetical protein
MPERTNQIIPVPLFHSSSTGDSTISVINPVSQAQALAKFGMPRFSRHLEMHRGDIGFNRDFHLAFSATEQYIRFASVSDLFPMYRQSRMAGSCPSIMSGGKARSFSRTREVKEETWGICREESRW